MTDFNDDTALSRSGKTSPDGKLTARLDVPVSDVLNEALIGLAVIQGVSKAEFARGILERVIFGELNMMRRIARTGPSSPSEESGTR
ncbi:hypothetical protein B9Z51_08775 [Limnohabitans sp. T6-5]|uniref:hypothetical protein n=1 Tax=Limnohabitans sp. T6-5 TaxID=1100724 RepID=UPI000D33B3A5|nr:hypothetical protein [Limnohabitans sp. T6-5]PUE09014.1 hypothetical protein B9Z51_08775 [Limnohabitans sp. T6-5]